MFRAQKLNDKVLLLIPAEHAEAVANAMAKMEDAGVGFQAFATLLPTFSPKAVTLFEKSYGRSAYDRIVFEDDIHSPSEAHQKCARDLADLAPQMRAEDELRTKLSAALAGLKRAVLNSGR